MAGLVHSWQAERYLQEILNVLRMTSKVLSSGYPSQIPFLTAHWKKQATLWNVVRIHDEGGGGVCRLQVFQESSLTLLSTYRHRVQNSGASSCGRWKVLPVLVLPNPEYKSTKIK
jgi:hypothetical protein